MSASGMAPRRTRVFSGAMPDTDIVFSLEEFFVRWRQANHGAALRADEVFTGNADGPAKPRGHADDLVGGVNGARPPDLRNRRHLVDGCKHLDADHGGLEPQQVVEIGHHGGQIERFRRRLLLHGVNSLIGDPCACWR